MTARVTDSPSERSDVGLQLLQHLGGNLLRRPGASGQFDPHRLAALARDGIADDHLLLREFAAAPAHEALDGRYGLLAA